TTRAPAYLIFSCVRIRPSGRLCDLDRPPLRGFWTATHFVADPSLMNLGEPSAPLLETRIPELPLWRRGKVRDVYDLGERLLIVATDRLSAFDVVLPTGIPQKGVLLTQLSLFWFHELA